MTEMRAWQVQGAGEPIDVLREVTLEVPEPGPGLLRLRVAAAGIGLPDVLMCRGTYPLTPPVPFVSGQEAVGVVTAVGEGVDTAIGTRVMTVSAFFVGHGSFAEECLAVADTAVPVPAGLSDPEAAGFWIPHMTGWIGLVERGQVTAGEWLVVLGAAGGSGIAAVQLGAALGARVIAVVSDQARASFCTGLGAEVAIVRGDEPLAPALREATGGQGVDAIYDPVGGAMAEDAVGALARGGRLLAVGFAAGDWPRVDVPNLVFANATVMGVFAGMHSADELAVIHGELSGLIADGRLRTTVTEVVPFAELPVAVQRLADRQVVGKLVMDPGA